MVSGVTVSIWVVILSGWLPRNQLWNTRHCCLASLVIGWICWAHSCDPFMWPITDSDAYSLTCNSQDKRSISNIFFVVIITSIADVCVTYRNLPNKLHLTSYPWRWNTTRMLFAVAAASSPDMKRRDFTLCQKKRKDQNVFCRKGDKDTLYENTIAEDKHPF